MQPLRNCRRTDPWWQLQELPRSQHFSLVLLTYSDYEITWGKNGSPISFFPLVVFTSQMFSCCYEVKTERPLPLWTVVSRPLIFSRMRAQKRVEEDPTCNPSAIDQASRRKPYARGNVVWHEERVTFSFHDQRRVVSFLYFAELDCYHFQLSLGTFPWEKIFCWLDN